MAGEDSPAAVAWAKFVDAVIAHRRGDKDAVVAYLRSVEAEHGRPVALQAKDSILACARSEKWADVEAWPHRGYRVKPPPSPPAPEKPRRKR